VGLTFRQKGLWEKISRHKILGANYPQYSSWGAGNWVTAKNEKGKQNRVRHVESTLLGGGGRNKPLWGTSFPNESGRNC